FTVPGYLNATRPGTTNMVLEIDRLLVDIGYTQLALADEIEVIVDDARTSLQQLPDHMADVVIGDAYSGASVPWHLTTVEFMEDVSRVLAADGVYVMNVIDYGQRRFARSSAATIGTVFEHVAVLAPPLYIDGDGGGNYIIVASHRPIDVAALEEAIVARGGEEIGLSGSDLVDFVDGAMVLTDDFAPVDQIVGSPSS
ncbi:MAG: fused MFS/spermidine synthase, partial [Acidimicrobiia bacterium]|nr:fused MFS/spermidine synthase [Acidimicrobiia bacterium]